MLGKWLRDKKQIVYGAIHDSIIDLRVKLNYNPANKKSIDEELRDLVDTIYVAVLSDLGIKR